VSGRTGVYEAQMLKTQPLRSKAKSSRMFADFQRNCKRLPLCHLNVLCASVLDEPGKLPQRHREHRERPQIFSFWPIRGWSTNAA